MLRTFLSCTPFLVCLGWLLAFVFNMKRNDEAKKILTLFLATCTILYLCHAMFFTVGLSYEMECLWTLCSLSVYPLYFIYIYRLTGRKLSAQSIAMLLLPGLLVALGKYAYPVELMDTMRKALFAVQIVMVVYFGYRRLQAFDRELADVYADTDLYDTRQVRILLIAFLLTSLFSMAANAVGKQFFATSNWLILLVLTPFTVMLFALSYIGYTRDFTVPQDFAEEADSVDEDGLMEEPTQEMQDMLGVRIEQMINEERIYRRKNLKIDDVAHEVQSCRTYISRYINQTKGCSFSDYINSKRVEYTQQRLLQGSNKKITAIAEEAGFSSEASFYRNFQKFAGMKPAEWLKSRE